MKTDTMIFKWDESHEKRRCKYTLHTVCGYGMVFERKIKNKKKTKKIVCPFTLLVFYEASANISGIQTKCYLAIPCHIWIAVHWVFKIQAFLCTIIEEGLNPVAPSAIIFRWKTRFYNSSWKALWLIWKRDFVDVCKKIAQDKDAMSTFGRISTFVGGFVHVTSIAKESLKYHSMWSVSYKPRFLQKNLLDFHALCCKPSLWLEENVEI